MHIKKICIRCPQTGAEAEQPVTSVNSQKRLICSFQSAARQQEEPGGGFMTIVSSWTEEELRRRPDAAASKLLQESAAQRRNSKERRRVCPFALGDYLGRFGFPPEGSSEPQDLSATCACRSRPARISVGRAGTQPSRNSCLKS